MSERDPDRLADELEHEADTLERDSRRLADRVQEVRRDWEHKRSDPSVPGAPPPDADEAGKAEDGPAPEAEFPAKEPSREDD